MVRVKVTPKKGGVARESLPMVNKEIKIDQDDLSFTAFARHLQNGGGSTSTPKPQKVRSQSAKQKSIVKQRKTIKKGGAMSQKLAIPVRNFVHVVKLITREMGEFRWKKGAIKGIHAAAEDLLIEVFHRSLYCATLNGRTTVMQKDWLSAVYRMF